MRKTVLAPGFADSRAEGVPHVVFADGVVTHHPDHDRVILSGAGAPGETVAEQVTELFLLLDALLADVGGSLDDVVKTRYHVLADHLSRETQAEVDAVRAEFFEYPHYPASTMVGVADLLGDEMLVEVEVEVVIPRETERESGNTGEDADDRNLRDRREPLTTVLTREGESLTVEEAREREGLGDAEIEIEFETVDDTSDDDSDDGETGEKRDDDRKSVGDETTSDASDHESE